MASTALGTLTVKVKERLEAAEDLSAVTILWGPPTGDDTPGELVCVGSDMDANSGKAENRRFRLMGQQEIDEDLALPITVQVLQGFVGQDMKASYDRSMEIAAAVETAIRQDISFDNLLIEEAVLSEWAGRYLRPGESRGHGVSLTLTGTARI